MADFFISYARADRSKIEQLSSGLEAEGYSVWWDRHIGSGAEFSADIERELRAAKAVIVCWSEEGVKSRWVKDEATIAGREGKLKTISLDGTEPPIGYMQYHALDMSGWKGERDEPEFVELLRDAKAHFDSIQSASPAVEKSPATDKVVVEPIREPVAATAPVPSSAPTGFNFSDPKILGGAFAGLAALAGVAFFATRDGEVPTTTQPTEQVAGQVAGIAESSSIAVLPFVNMSSDPEQEYFSDGISEELLNVLAQVTGLQVAGRTSAFAFKGKDQNLSEIGEILNVANILEGSVRKSGNTVRITAQLIRADNGFHLWSETYDRSLDDIFAVQDEIANAILDELMPHLLGDGSVKTARGDIGAYDLYLLAKQYAATGDLAGYKSAASALDKAIAIDPEFAPALAWRSYYELMMSDGDGAAGDIPIEEALITAKALADRAMAVDPASADALFALAGYHSMIPEPDLAEVYYKRAIKAKPNFPAARNDYAYLLARDARIDAANEQLELALAHNPAQTDVNTNLIFNYRQMNDYKAAKAALDRWAEISPDSIPQQYTSASYLWWIGDWAGAMKAAQRIVEQSPDASRIKWLLNRGWLDLGEFESVLNSEAEFLHTQAHLLQGKVGRALELERVRIAERPQSPPVQRTYLYTLYYAGAWDELVSYFDKQWGSVAGFQAAFETPPFEPLLAPLIAADHAVAKEMLEAARVYIVERRAAGFDAGVVDFFDAAVLMNEGHEGEAIRRLQSAISKNQWRPDIGIDPLFTRLKDNPEFIVIVDATEAKINEERAKLDLAPITMLRNF